MSTPQRRYAALLEQLALEMGAGWQSKLARKFGVSPGLIQKQYAGARGPGAKTIQAATERLGIDPAFFYDESIGENPDYRNFLTGKRTPEPFKIPEVVAELLTTPLGKAIPPDLVGALVRIDWNGFDPTIQELISLVSARLARRATARI